MRDYQGRALLHSIGSSQPRFECQMYMEAAVVLGRSLSSDSMSAELVESVSIHILLQLINATSVLFK